MKSFVVLLLLNVIFMSPAWAADGPDKYIRQRDEIAIANSLQRILSRASHDNTVKVWIFFTDKGFSNLADYDLKLVEA